MAALKPAAHAVPGVDGSASLLRHWPRVRAAVTAVQLSLGAAGEALLERFAALVFSRRRAVGLLVLGALATTPSCLGLAACAALGAELALRSLRLSRGYVPYDYNALLCGIGLGRMYELTPTAAAFAVVLGAGCVLVTGALSSLHAYLSYLPVLAWPCSLATWLALGLAPQLPFVGVLPQLDRSASLLPPMAAELLQGLGGVVLQPNVLAGSCIALALVVHSRIACALALAAAGGMVGLLQLTAAPLSDLARELVVSNAALTAVALGSVFLVPSPQASALALAGALLAGFCALGSAAPLLRLGLTPGLSPFSAVVIAVVAALRQREEKRAVPQLATTLAESPEQLLLDELSRPRVPGVGLRITPPFVGAWTCTQGANGAFTHRGALQHAYDFELYADSDGSLCRTHGLTPEDYHCFAQPVIAVADGTVIASEASLRNNPIGDVDTLRPWGNYVVVQHRPQLYSVVAHLCPGSVTVYAGQQVARGTVLGYCGNSGQSPRPHLHFQLQTSAALGSPTVACELSDVLVDAAEPWRFEPLHVAAEGETLRALAPDYAFASLFDIPLGSRLTYRRGEQVERIVCEVDGWGRWLLRSLDCPAELVITRSASCFHAGELRGSARSSLRLLRIALGCVPFERQPLLSFESDVPERWLEPGALRSVSWDVAAAVGGARTVALCSRIVSDATGLTVVGESPARLVHGVPCLQTRARLDRGPGPALLEVSWRGRTEQAVRITEVEGTRSVRAALTLPLGEGA